MYAWDEKYHRGATYGRSDVTEENYSELEYIAIKNI